MLEFKNVIVEIGCNGQNALNMVEMLFCDLPLGPIADSGKNRIRYEVLLEGDGQNSLLFKEDGQLYCGSWYYTLAYMLVGEVLYHCIADNESQHALHAGAVHRGGCGIILPGSSGRGKSTLTAWLCTKGFGYLTDELIFLADDGRMTPFTRPINLKTLEPIVSSQFLETNREQILLAEDGATMIPHRLLNKDFSAQEPIATHILFPEYKKGVKAELHSISPAQSVFMLLQSHVNARNLPSHGVASLSTIARKCQSFSLVYSDFDEVESLLLTMFENCL